MAPLQDLLRDSIFLKQLCIILVMEELYGLEQGTSGHFGMSQVQR